MLKNLWIPFLILIVSVAIGLYFRPLITIDETRYLSVAWEMFDKHSFLVPLINGEPYDHKPPFLFWMMNLDWLIFGVNELSVRLIPLVFALGSVVLTYLIYVQLWPKDTKGAKFIGWVLAGTMMFAFYSSLVMFDIMLGFWVLLGILGIIKAVQTTKTSAYGLILLAVGFGILTKGPVVVAHLLPLFLFAKFWAKEKATKRFFIGFVLAVTGGIAFALIWGIPAAIEGGEAYRNAIFLGQTVGRVAHSFAHNRPLWWYLPIIPILTFPWFFYTAIWRNLKIHSLDEGLKFLIAWMAGTLVIFSLISGKQVHYILPEIAAFALFTTRLISLSKAEYFSARIVGVIYSIFAVAFAVAPYVIPKYLQALVDIRAFWISAAMLLAVGIYLTVKRFSVQEHLVKILAVSPIVLIFSVHFVLHNYLKSQDLTLFSQKIASLQQKGIVVVHDRKYHDQFHFLGRLHDKILVIKDKTALEKFIKEHPDSVIITYKKRKETFDANHVIAKAKLRTTNILLVKAGAFDAL